MFLHNMDAEYGASVSGKRSHAHMPTRAHTYTRTHAHTHAHAHAHTVHIQWNCQPRLLKAGLGCSYTIQSENQINFIFWSHFVRTFFLLWNNRTFPYKYIYIYIYKKNCTRWRGGFRPSNTTIFKLNKHVSTVYAVFSVKYFLLGLVYILRIWWP